jgi:hypothetical protein
MQVTVDIPEDLADHHRGVGLDPTLIAQNVLSAEGYQCLLASLPSPRTVKATARLMKI